MWKRGEIERPPLGGRDAVGAGLPGAPPVAAPPRGHSPESEATRHMDKDVLHIGQSVVFKGELGGGEDLMIEGIVEGKIELRDHVLTIGPHARIKAEVFAKVVVVRGEVVGNITASEKLDIRDSGSIDGNIAAPVVSIAEGAHLRGSVDMQKKPVAAAAPAPAGQAAKVEPRIEPKAEPRPAGAPVPGGPRPAGA